MSRYPTSSAEVTKNVALLAFDHAYAKAMSTIAGLHKTPTIVELFWVAFNYEFRQFIERNVKEYANLEEG